jgi:predicted RNase H-like nuclease (RuvC/YqgF family)
MTLCKTIVRWTIVAGLALGGITLIIGPERVEAAFGAIQTQATALVDEYIDVEEAQALRSRLHELAEAYPDRIAEIRGEVARVETQLEQFAHDADVARRVVAMTGADLEQLALKVQSAERGGVRTVSLVSGDAGVNLDVAYREGRRIKGIHETYQERLVSDQRQITMLETQRERLAALLEQIEDEFADYQAQVWQLDRQIDSIQRNDRLIALTESQQATLRAFESPGNAEGLRAIETRLAELQAVQEGTLQALTERGRQNEYEHRAQMMLNQNMPTEGTTFLGVSDTRGGDPFAEFLPAPPKADLQQALTSPTPITTPS